MTLHAIAILMYNFILGFTSREICRDRRTAIDACPEVVLAHRPR